MEAIATPFDRSERITPERLAAHVRPDQGWTKNQTLVWNDPDASG
jgi:hypothetical protein